MMSIVKTLAVMNGLMYIAMKYGYDPLDYVFEDMILVGDAGFWLG